MHLRNSALVGWVLLAAACAKEQTAQPDPVVVLPVQDAPAPTLAADAGSTPAAGPAHAVADSAAPATAADASSAACPAQFDRGDRRCKVGDAPCSYPEGECVCSGPPQCGGAAMRAPVTGESGVRYCTPKSESQLRADGCTYGKPTSGAPCAKPGMTCVYGPCAWSAATASCVNGHWQITQYNGPGPP